MVEYTNRCVIKMFDIAEELIRAEAIDYINDKLEIEISENYKDIRVELINYSDNDIAFNNLVARLNRKFAQYIYADSDITLEKCLVDTLTEKGKFISVAESLTGGKIASRIVGVSGASNVFYEGIVSYNPGAKVRRLHVPLQIINKSGTVNIDVARAMVLGLFDNKEIDFAFSTTGIAGPLSDEFNTPVGRVYIGFGDRKYIEVNELNLTGSREDIRETTVNYALFFMLRYINKYN